MTPIRIINTVSSSVPEPWPFGTDPDPHPLLFWSVTFKMPTTDGSGSVLLSRRLVTWEVGDGLIPAGEQPELLLIHDVNLPAPLLLLLPLHTRNRGMDEWTKKTPNSKCWIFFKIDLLTDFAAFVFNRFYRLEIHSHMVGIFDPACEMLPPMDEGTILVYCCPSTFSLTSPPFLN